MGMCLHILNMCILGISLHIYLEDVYTHISVHIYLKDLYAGYFFVHLS